MEKQTNMKTNKTIFLVISILTILLSGVFTFLNFYEYITVGILEQIDGYNFGGEGPVPYFYKTAKLYWKVMLVWGIIFLTMLLLAIRTAIRKQQKKMFWLLGVTILLILVQFLHGQIGV